MGRGKGLLALLNGAGLLGLEVRQQRLLVAVPEGRGVELAGLAVENVLGKLAHVRRNGAVRHAHVGTIRSAFPRWSTHSRRIVVLGEAHLRRILTKYAAYYNELR